MSRPSVPNSSDHFLSPGWFSLGFGKRPLPPAYSGSFASRRQIAQLAEPDAWSPNKLKALLSISLLIRTNHLAYLQQNTANRGVLTAGERHGLHPCEKSNDI
jgi:hypothetical protein